MKNIKWILTAFYFLLLSFVFSQFNSIGLAAAAWIFLPLSAIAFCVGLMGKDE